MIAALYVDTARGPYPRIRNVECWGFASKDGVQLDMIATSRDARQYVGPWPVVAHPPCGPWGRFRWHYKGGEGDRDCGIRAVEQVRAFGGVLEHPACSSLWYETHLPTPGQPPDKFGGWSIQVNQVDWGHEALKPTWLYFCGVHQSELPDLPPPSEPTKCMVRLRSNPHLLMEVPKKDRHITPLRFAEWLVEAVSGVGDGRISRHDMGPVDA